MGMFSKIIALIPTYNEKENICLLLQELIRLYPGMDILVIDDNSPDGTGKAVEDFSREEPNVHILHRKAKLGLAQAYQEGFDWVLARDYDYLVLMDGDLSHQPGYIAAMLDFIRNGGGYDVVIGSRYVDGGRADDWAFWRFVASRLGNIYSRFVLGLAIRDLTSGFKCLKKEALSGIDYRSMRSNGYVFQVEMVFLLLESGFRVKEYPIIFPGRKKGRSKLSLRLFIEAFCLIPRLRFGRKKKIAHENIAC